MTPFNDVFIIEFCYRLFNFFNFHSFKRVNHYEGHEIFQDIGHQLHKNILYCYLHYRFYKILIEFEMFLQLTSNHLQVTFVTLSIGINYLHLNN